MATLSKGLLDQIEDLSYEFRGDDEATSVEGRATSPPREDTMSESKREEIREVLVKMKRLLGEAEGLVTAPAMDGNKKVAKLKDDDLKQVLTAVTNASIALQQATSIADIDSLLDLVKRRLENEPGPGVQLRPRAEVLTKISSSMEAIQRGSPGSKPSPGTPAGKKRTYDALNSKGDEDMTDVPPATPIRHSVLQSQSSSKKRAGRRT